MAGAADLTTAVPVTAGGGAGFGGPPTTAMSYTQPPEKKRTGLYVGILVAVLAVAGLGLFFLANNLGKSTPQVEVPDVTGSNVVDATNTLRNAGFKVTVKNQANDTVPLNEVFQQTPKGNTKADQGSTIEIVVSGGVGDAKVPDVTGRTQAAAESLLKTSGFIPEAIPTPSDTIPTGQVISQSPAANTTATKNSVVQINVSSGLAQVAVPDVTGMTATAASNALGQAGFKVSTTTQPSSSVPANSVISTNPSAGTQAAKGSNVTLVVSSGPSSTTSSSTTSTTKAP
jgi:serine/threonine-protein kinase